MARRIAHLTRPDRVDGGGRSRMQHNGAGAILHA